MTKVMGKIDKVRSADGLNDFIFDEIRELDQINSISALTHNPLKTLMERNYYTSELFDEQNTV